MIKNVMGMLFGIQMVFVVLCGSAHAGDTYAKQECHGKGKAKVCHVVHVKKISTDIQYLDMSEIEGKTSDLPEITKKGEL